MKPSEVFRQDCHGIWEASHNHPFVQSLGRGTLPADKFRFYLAQDYLYLIDFSRFFAVAAAKSKALAVMGRFSRLLHETLDVEMELHRSICADFGISADSLAATRPAPTTLAYTSYLLRVAYEQDLVGMLSALLPCSWGYGEIGLRLRAAGMPAERHYAKWIETYASAGYQELVGWLRQLFDTSVAARSAGEKTCLLEVFATSSRWEYLFWEMAWRQEQWPV